jgi:putative membrane protein
VPGAVTLSDIMRARGSTPVHFAQGLLMGGADIIPGVSGGTVALIVGIYERLIDSIRALASAGVRLLRADGQEARRCTREVEWRLVLPLGAGIVCAIGVGSLVLPGLLERYPQQMLALFFGLVAASVPIPWRRIEQATWAHLGIAAVAAVIAFVLVGIPPQTIDDPPLLQVFASASFAIIAMILPGVSGAFLLKVLGVYEVTLESLRALDLAYVATFVAGAVVGLGVFSKLLSWLLHHRHDVTMAALVGLMVGSLRALWPWQDDDRGLLAPSGDGTLVAVIALAVLGFAAVTLLVRLGDRSPDDERVR